VQNTRTCSQEVGFHTFLSTNANVLNVLNTLNAEIQNPPRSRDYLKRFMPEENNQYGVHATIDFSSALILFQLGEGRDTRFFIEHQDQRPADLNKHTPLSERRIVSHQTLLLPGNGYRAVIGGRRCPAAIRLEGSHWPLHGFPQSFAPLLSDPTLNVTPTRRSKRRWRRVCVCVYFIIFILLNS